MNKKIKILSLLLAIIIFFTFFILFIEKSSNNPKYKNKISNLSLNIFLKLPDVIKSTLFVLTGRKNFSNLFNDYNVKFLPNTQLIDLDISRIKTDFDKGGSLKKFYLEIFKEDLILTNQFGEFFRINLNDIIDGKNILLKKINIDNLFNFDGIVLDTLVAGREIFVAKSSKHNNCEKLEIYKAEIDQLLNFEIFKSFAECKAIGIGAGRLANYSFNKQDGILITTNDSDNDNPGEKAQNDESIFGKIIFVDKNTKNYIIISKGHRNAQGISVNGDIILSTEHGPKGGDEINRIMYGKNYGWPIASYGVPYKNKNLKYLDSHKKHGFQEPLYAFVPSIGISELIFLPNTFNAKWKNSVLVTSLNGRSIYRMKFEDENYNKIIYHEKIFIGERIRDIKYSKDLNYIFLALERTGDLGIIKNID